MHSDVVCRFVFLCHRYGIIILVTLLVAIHGTVIRAAVDIVCISAGNLYNGTAYCNTASLVSLSVYLSVSSIFT
jgi:hypothetical protein